MRTGLVRLCLVASLIALISSVLLAQHQHVDLSGVAAQSGTGPQLSWWRPLQLSHPLIPIMDARYLQLDWTMDGYQRSGIPLVAYKQGVYVPAGSSDDQGLFLLIPFICGVWHLSLQRGLDLVLLSIAALGLVTGSIGVRKCVSTAWGRILAEVALLFVGVLTLSIGDVYVAQSSLVIAVVPWVVHFFQRGRFRYHFFGWAFVFGFTVFGFNVLRMHSGTAVALFVGVIIFAKRGEIRKKMFCLVAASLGFVLGLLLFQQAIHRRDFYLRTEDSAYRPIVAHHPVWHTIYAGFGFLQNDYGLTWNDSVPIEKVRSIDPNASYLSPQYERILRQAVISFVLDNPRFVMQTLLTKLSVLLLIFAAIANVGLVAAIRHPKPWPIELAFGTALAFSAVPSVLAVPHPSYMLGFIAFSALYCVLSVEFVLQQRSTRPLQLTS